MNTIHHQSLRAKVQQLAEFIIQAQPGRMSFESEEQFLAMLSLGSSPQRVRVRQSPIQSPRRHTG